MFITFPPAPAFEGYTHCGIKPVFIRDPAWTEDIIVPVYVYRCDTTGAIHLHTIPKLWPLVERLIAAGHFDDVEADPS